MPPGDPRLDAGLGLDESEIQGLVNNAVLRDDVTPLLRILFSYTTAAIAKAEQEAAEAAAAAAAGQGQPAFAGPAYGVALAANQARGDTALGGHEALAAITKCLKSVASEQEQVIRDICHTHAMDIAGFVADLHDMQDGVVNLQQLIQQCNTELQAAGQPLMQHLTNMTELVEVQDNVAAGLAAIRGARDVLQRCLKVGQLLEDRQLYKALQAIYRIQTKHLPALLDQLTWSDPAPPAAAGQPSGQDTATRSAPTPWGTSGQAGGGGGAAGRRAANVVSLRAFFEGVVGELLAAVEALAISEMHTWLESARKQACGIGLHTVRQAAIQRQREEDLALEWVNLKAAIHMGDMSLPQLCASLVAAPFRQELLRDGSWPPAAGDAGLKSGLHTDSQEGGKAAAAARTSPVAAVNGSDVIRIQGVLSGGELEQLQLGSPHLAVVSLVEKHSKQLKRRQTKQVTALKAIRSAGQGVDVGVQGPGSLMALGAQLCTASDATLPVMAGLAMRGLLSCVHLYQALGRTVRLQEYYTEQRRLQIAADLAAPYIPFLEHYQTYLGQVLGFFVIESSVRRLVPDLMPPGSAAMLWESTVPQVKATLESALCHGGHLMRGPAAVSPPAAGSQAVQGGGRGVGGGGAAAQAAIMIMIKDFVLLVVEAFEQLGYATAPLQEVLVAAAVPYHELITSDVAPKVKSVIVSDTLGDKVKVNTSQEQHKLIHVLGLPTSLIQSPISTTGAQPGRQSMALRSAAGGGGGGVGGVAEVGRGSACNSPLEPPFSCPFTALVPALLGHIRDYVQDSVSFLRGVVPPGDLQLALMHYRDRLVQQTIAEALHERVQAATSMHVLMCMVADVWCMGQAVPALEAHLGQAGSALAAVQAPAGGGLGEGGGAAGRDAVPGRDQSNKHNRSAVASSSTLTSTALGGGALPPSIASTLQSVQQAAERALLKMVMSRVDDILATGFKSTNWLPVTYLDGGPSPHVQPLINYLQECFEEAVHSLPVPAWTALMRSAVKCVGLSYMKLFTPDGVKGYNLVAVERLSFDISAVQNFAARAAAHASTRHQHMLKAAGTATTTLHIAPIQQQDMADQLAEPEQLFRLLLAHKFDEITVSEVRKRVYPNLGLPTILLALDKYRELTKIDKVATPFPTRKQVDAVAKTLQGQVTAEATG